MTVEGLLEAGPAKLAQIVGDRASAVKLADAARKLLAASPAATGPVRRPTEKKATPKKPK